VLDLCGKEQERVGLIKRGGDGVKRGKVPPFGKKRRNRHGKNHQRFIEKIKRGEKKLVQDLKIKQKCSIRYSGTRENCKGKKKKKSALLEEQQQGWPKKKNRRDNHSLRNTQKRKYTLRKRTLNEEVWGKKR